jgi:competence ComEA-like helix-hairpin-helix protein
MRVGTEGKSADPDRARAILLLSLTLLLYNLAASGRQDRFWAPSSAALSLSGGASMPSAPGAVPAGSGPPSLRQRYLAGAKVHVNRASAHEISDLPGISDRVAGAFVAERSRIGRFRRPEDLLSVPGIKEKRLRKILPFLTGFDNN